jgi:hypothetical protein
MASASSTKTEGYAMSFESHHGSRHRRGYGYEHVKIREALIAAWQPGDLCTACGQPMYGPPALIHLAHNEERTGYAGLQHAKCNVSAAGKTGNAKRQAAVAAPERLSSCERPAACYCRRAFADLGGWPSRCW